MRHGRHLSRATGLLLAAVLAGTLLVATPGSPTQAQSPKRGGVFRVPAPDAPNLDPHRPGFTHSDVREPRRQPARPLPRRPGADGSGDHHIVPDLAEKWEYTNPTTVVFTLRKGVQFHKKPPVNGREVTAEDVKYSLERFRLRSDRPAVDRTGPVHRRPWTDTR